MSREAAGPAEGTTLSNNPTTARAHTLRSGAGPLVPRMTAAPCVCVGMMVVPRWGAAGMGKVGWGINLAAGNQIPAGGGHQAAAGHTVLIER